MPSHLVLPQQFGRYRIVQKIGEGGMGRVYLAEDLQLGRKIALKVPNFAADERPEIIDRFHREARVAANIEHHNICQVYDVGEIDGIHYLTMPYIEGTPLSHLIREDNPWVPRQAAELVRVIALAVHSMHLRGVMHRDLKPGNIMLRSRLDPVLMDFGLARSFEELSQRVTAPDSPIGTPSYMSPEQVHGDNDRIGPATDIYSLGVILYEMVTGRLPFVGPLAAVYGQILHTSPPLASSRHPEVDAHMDAICLKAMAKDPRNRYISMEEFASTLETYVQQRESTSAISGAVLLEIPPEEEPGTLRLACPACSKLVKIPPSFKGKRVKCPRCGAHLGGSVTQPPPPVPVTQRPTSRGKITVKDREREPRHRSRGWLIAVFWFLVLIGGVIGAWRWWTGRWPWNPLKGEFTNSLGMKLVLIPKGKFDMGSPRSETGRYDTEEQREVKLAHPFYISAHEVTTEQFRRFVEATGYKTEAETSGTGWGYDPASGTLRQGAEFNWKNVGWERREDHPVVNVTWNDAQAFCAWLSRREEKTYSLPTEAEWEYACRAGTTSAFSTGSNPEDLAGVGNVADETARNLFPTWTTIQRKDNFAHTAPVGRFAANGLGLYDMHGNVREWCEDHYFRDGANAAKVGDARVVRGGSWRDEPRHCRSAYRGSLGAGECDCFTGFRVVMWVKE